MEGQVLCIVLWDVLLQRSSGYVQVGILLLLLLQYYVYYAQYANVCLFVFCKIGLMLLTELCKN